MGHMCHHAIVVTANSMSHITPAHTKAREIFGEQVTEILLPTKINGYCTFFVGPDGSKEDWHESDVGDAKRAEFMAWLVSSKQYIAAAEIQFWDDDAKTNTWVHPVDYREDD